MYTEHIIPSQSTEAKLSNLHAIFAPNGECFDNNMCVPGTVNICGLYIPQVGDLVSISGYPELFKVVYILGIQCLVQSVADSSYTVLINSSQLTKVYNSKTDQGLDLTIPEKLNRVPDDIITEQGLRLSGNITDNIDKVPVNISLSKEQNNRTCITDKELTLAEKLQNCKNAILYCSELGTVILVDVDTSQTRPIKLRIESDDYIVHLYEDGSFVRGGECVLRPYNVSWDEFFNNIPKTITDMKNNSLFKHLSLEIYEDGKCYSNNIEDIAARKAVALIKLHQLIDKGYEGVVSYEEYKKIISSTSVRNYTLYTICLNKKTYYIKHVTSNVCYNNLIFRNYNLAKEFLSYDENKLLLDEYFGIKTCDD